MTATGPFSPQTFRPHPADALKLWLAVAEKYGQHGNGVVFCPNSADCDLYVRAAYKILPAHHYKVRAFNGGAGYLLGTGAALDVTVVSCEEDAYAHAARSWPFIIYHDPASWASPKLMAYLLGMLRSSQYIPTQLITVASPFLIGVTVNAEDVSPQSIDYAAITKSVVGGI